MIEKVCSWACNCNAQAREMHCEDFHAVLNALNLPLLQLSFEFARTRQNSETNLTMATRISPTRSLGSSSREQWNDISCSSASVQNFPESNSTPSPIRDDTQASARQVGSGSRSQWTSLSEPEAFQRSSTELDLALGDAPMAMGTPSDDASDDLSAFLRSEATYDHSMATARTGHVSNNSAEVMHTVTPDSSPKEARSSRRGRS